MYILTSHRADGRPPGPESSILPAAAAAGGAGGRRKKMKSDESRGAKRRNQMERKATGVETDLLLDGGRWLLALLVSRRKSRRGEW
jgi:hypothetical protein